MEPTVTLSLKQYEKLKEAQELQEKVKEAPYSLDEMVEISELSKKLVLNTEVYERYNKIGKIVQVNIREQVIRDILKMERISYMNNTPIEAELNLIRGDDS